MAEQLGFRRESCHVSPGGLGVPPDVMDRRRRRPPRQRLGDAEQDARLLDRRRHGRDDRPGRMRVVQRRGQVRFPGPAVTEVAVTWMASCCPESTTLPVAPV